MLDIFALAGLTVDIVLLYKLVSRRGKELQAKARCPFMHGM